MKTGTKSRSVIFAALVALLGSGEAPAAYPDRPVRLIVPFAPGGPADLVARLVAQKLTDSFGQSVVIDNRPGGGGATGVETAVRATPDGYTMAAVTASYATNAALSKLPYDPINDVTPVSLIGSNCLMIAIHPGLPVSTVRELIEYDRINPGKLNYGSSGNGTALHLATELFNQMARTHMMHVPYKGAGPALNDVIGGQIQVIFSGLPQLVPQVKANRVRGIAVTGAKRSSVLPALPAVAETVPNYQAEQWQAILGPKALPKEIVARWSNEITRILRLPQIRERLAADGSEPVDSSPAHFREVLVRDVAKWRNVIRTANLKPEN